MAAQNVARKSRTWIWVISLSVSILISISSYLYGLVRHIEAENNLGRAMEMQREALAQKALSESQRDECEKRVAELTRTVERLTERALENEYEK